MQMGNDDKGEIYFTSLIIKIDNPDAVEIVAAFRQMIISNQK